MVGMTKENCIICGEETVYSMNDHIDFRIGYIKGSGQLCLDCYEKLYIKESYNAKKKKNDQKKYKWQL